MVETTVKHLAIGDTFYVIERIRKFKRDDCEECNGSAFIEYKGKHISDLQPCPFCDDGIIQTIKSDHYVVETISVGGIDIRLHRNEEPIVTYSAKGRFFPNIDQEMYLSKEECEKRVDELNKTSYGIIFKV